MFCKLNPDGNCPRRGDRRVTPWSLCTHPICLSFPLALHAPPLLLQSAALSPGLSWAVLGCPAHPSPFILAHTKLAAHVFLHLFVSLLF